MDLPTTHLLFSLTSSSSSDFLTGDALLFAVLAPALALIVYGGILWNWGGAHGREEALDVWRRAIVAAALAASVFIIPAFIGTAIDIYQKAAHPNSTTCINALAIKEPDLQLSNYAKAVKQSMDCAAKVFENATQRIADTYTNLFQSSTVTGFFGVTSALSMGLFQIALPFSGAASGALLTLTAVKVAAYVAIGFALLAGLGAALIAMERLQVLGAVIVAGAMAMPPVLAGLADAVSPLIQKIPEAKGLLGVLSNLAAWDWGKYVHGTGAVAEITAYAALALSIMAAATAAISYALSKVPQHLSVE